MEPPPRFIPQPVLPFDGHALYWGPIVDGANAEAWFEGFLREIPWVHDEVIVFGKTRVTARRVSWHGDSGCDYAYAGRRKVALPWTPLLDLVKSRVEERAGCTFNSCLLNLYHSGVEGMGWHRDNEPELGPEPVIASMSLGARRRFLFRHRRTKQTVEIHLEPGSLLVMSGACQQNWMHSLPKSLRVKEPRINLTFRRVHAERNHPTQGRGSFSG
jgi:alkylated DNA repair dioxygenase AlkB